MSLPSVVLPPCSWLHETSSLRRVAILSLVSLGAVVTLVPWNLVAAEPKVEEKDAQRVAAIRIWEGKPKKILAEPKVVFTPSTEATFSLGNDARRVDLTIHSLPGEKPMQHVVEVKLIRDPNGDWPMVLSSPRLVVLDGKTGRIRIEGATILEIEATVVPVR